MKKNHVVLLVLLLVGEGGAFAQCSAPYENGNSVQGILSGKTVCVTGSKQGWGGWENQEYHAPTAAGAAVPLIELHTGTSADPEEIVGTWAYSNTGKVTHTYNAGGGTYLYDIKVVSGVNYFCPGNIQFTTRGGKTRC